MLLESETQFSLHASGVLGIGGVGSFWCLTPVKTNGEGNGIPLIRRAQERGDSRRVGVRCGVPPGLNRCVAQRRDTGAVLNAIEQRDGLRPFGVVGVQPLRERAEIHNGKRNARQPTICPGLCPVTGSVMLPFVAPLPPATVPPGPLIPGGKRFQSSEKL